MLRMSPGQRCGQTSSGDAALVKPGELDRAFSRCTVLRSVVSCAAGQGMPHPWFLLEQEQGDIGLSRLLCTRQERSAQCVGEVSNHFPQGITSATGLPGFQE